MRRALVFAALLCACREKAAQPPPPAEQQAPAASERVREQEPNDFQRAQQIPARALVAGTLQAPRDDDWYRVLRVHAGGDDPGVVPGMACLEACFVKVSGTGLQEYELTVLGGEPRPGEELEPNDRAVDATELRPGSPVRGTFLTADDEDWYRLSVPDGSGDVLRIEVTPVEGVRPELEVRALGDATLLATFRGTEGLFVRNLSVHLGETADAGAPDGGPVPAGYYLVLKGKSRRGAPLAPYTLTATVEAGAQDLELEPNDDPEHATPLRETATGFLAPSGDQDWYRVHVDAPAVLHAELSGADRADLELAVYAAAGTEKPRLLARANEGGPRELEVVPAVGIPAGDSYLLVQAAARQLEGKWVRDGEDRQTPYRLAVQLSPDDGSTEREPNDEVATAQLVSLPVAVKGWIWPRKDVDLFRFHVEAGHAPVNVMLPAVRGVDLQLRLYQLRGDRPPEVIGSSDAKRGDGEEKLIAVPLKEGDYAVEVSSPRHKDASASQAYTLTVQ